LESAFVAFFLVIVVVGGRRMGRPGQRGRLVRYIVKYVHTRKSREFASDQALPKRKKEGRKGEKDSYGRK
jgi:hypothetical protein